MSRVLRGMVVGACTIPVLAGAVVLAQRLVELRPVRIEREGLSLEVLGKRWVHDVMQHGEGSFGTPQAMVPGMPVAGEQRLSIELRLFNTASSARAFDPLELELVSDSRQRREPSQIEVERTLLRPRQALTTSMAFDVPEGGETWTLRWRDRPVFSADGPEAAPKRELKRWPASVDALPVGSRKRGAALYGERYACASCHGDPMGEVAGVIGPSLDWRSVQAGAARTPGKGERQFLYEAILDPSATVAPECPGGVACESPSAMPWYADSMSREELADMIEFLMGAGRDRG